MSFGKIFESTFTGSMIGAGGTVFAVWGYVISHTKPPGIVELNPVLLSALIGESVEKIKEAIQYLSSPDEMSRTPDDEGRRLVQVDQFLYRVPTWQKYRNMRNDEERRQYFAEAKRRQRQREKAENPEKLSNAMSKTVKDMSNMSTQAEAEAESEAINLSSARAENPNGFGQDQEAWIAQIQRTMPDIDVEGEMKSYLAFVAKKKSNASRAGFLGWLKKASPKLEAPKHRYDY